MWHCSKFVLLLGGFFSIWNASAVAGAETVTRQGVHLRLTSDVADERLLDDLVSAFDAAVPQWLAFWGFPADRATGWRIDGFLMEDVDAFRRDGKLPGHIPDFKNGFATPDAIWIQRQSSIYYNRHLVLHEGVHALAFELFGGGGPSWYMEGTAELLATHRDRSEALRSGFSGAEAGLLAQAETSFRVNELPRRREDSSMWGRYRVIEKRRESGSLPTLASVMKLPTNLQGDVNSYAWCWAASLMLTAYPETRDAFIAAARNGRDQSPSFTTRFYREIGDQWPAVRARWRVWMDDLEYGFDRDAYRVNLSTDDPRYDGAPVNLAVDSRRGWQSTGVWFPAGTVRVQASGQCVVVAEATLQQDSDDDPNAIVHRDWISTPAGITVRYHRGAPIGQLQVCVLPIPSSGDKQTAPLRVQSLNTAPNGAVRSNVSGVVSGTVAFREVQIDRPSWLLFRINDVPGEIGRYQRADNRGEYQVQVSR
ncbi:hypothetical protein [Rhodopirellula sallentina]|uniref:Putative secreted protein n=1 Tax=Rhodopirellula sallentina SM41 TaxID=1263870 RepID=M5TXH1_9BACT|nr:hypothetical protein [Rhodopirellula sallentina]EMI53885.1 putative secreted protein [Rhodopirellula sallentina SM41]